MRVRCAPDGPFTIMFPTSSPIRLGSLTLLSLALFPAFSVSYSQDRIGIARQASLQGSSAPLASADSAGPATAAPETAPKLEGDSEYGVQRILYRRSNWEPFSVSLDFGAYYTDNVALVDAGEQDDFFFRSGLRAAFTPQLKGGLFFTTSLGSEIYRYADADFFDFDLLSFDAGFLYATPRQGTFFDPLFSDLITYVKYGYYRISDPWDWADDNFDNHSIIAGFQKVWRISRGHQIYAGANADWSVDANLSAPQRDEYSAFLGYRVKWTADLESNLTYRAALYDYHDFGRTDFNQIVSLGLTYRFTDWLSANASFSATFNNSDWSVFDYNALNTGVVIGLQAKW